MLAIFVDLSRKRPRKNSFIMFWLHFWTNVSILCILSFYKIILIHSWVFSMFFLLCPFLFVEFSWERSTFRWFWFAKIVQKKMFQIGFMNELKHPASGIITSYTIFKNSCDELNKRWMWMWRKIITWWTCIFELCIPIGIPPTSAHEMPKRSE